MILAHHPFKAIKINARHLNDLAVREMDRPDFVPVVIGTLHNPGDVRQIKPAFFILDGKETLHLESLKIVSIDAP